MTDLIEAERHGQHMLLVLNRPEKLNALSYPLIDALMARLDAAEDDDSVRCVILTGKGTRAFSAGADIAGFAPDLEASPEQALRRFLMRGQALTRRIETFPKPVIAAINGLAFGGGCEMTEACSLAVAAEHATFAKPEIRLGFPPTFGGTQRLPRHVGRKRANEMILTGDAISAAEAERIGLVNRVVSAGTLLRACLDLADRIARHSPIAVTACLRAVTRGINVPVDEGLAIEAMQFRVAAASADAREGTRAFLEKREPVFTGR
ncbi:Crotonyl-CoA hydratase [Cupriavidus yeoncheonensis]|uniref:Crotonyl-CoA hydratase n=1 Tax=Cupriavidus yeoncheonensis TaxID=1462994 RepID=A0A916J3K9_9BURK|nr:crotonase/enoyl-CoA hydratase family protein [Cupriavidus yeoncheonensis]CAG2157938.1 Crotonyl-CoA hydratase [Cupriavidus yeoncheonensis]